MPRTVSTQLCKKVQMIESIYRFTSRARKGISTILSQLVLYITRERIMYHEETYTSRMEAFRPFVEQDPCMCLAMSIC